jgi:hypothetical protein
LLLEADVPKPHHGAYHGVNIVHLATNTQSVRRKIETKPHHQTMKPYRHPPVQASCPSLSSHAAHRPIPPRRPAPEAARPCLQDNEKTY